MIFIIDSQGYDHTEWCTMKRHFSTYFTVIMTIGNLLCLQILFVYQSLGLVISTCPTGLEFCREDHDFFGSDITPFNSAISNKQDCVNYCSTVPGSVGGGYTTIIPFACMCKFALDGPGNHVSTLDVFSFANTTAIRVRTAHCEETTKGCANMNRIKSYIISYTNMDVHCGDPTNGDQIRFGDFDGDGVCDVACWNEKSAAVKWAKGSDTLKFLKPPNTPPDGSIGSFCTPNSTLEVKDVNSDSKDDLVCISQDDTQSAMKSDVNGLNPLLLISYEPKPNCQNLPNECLFRDNQSSCGVCPTTGTIHNGVYAKTDQKEFTVACQDGYKYRGQAAPTGICNPITMETTLEDGMCMKQTPTEYMNWYSKKKIDFNAIATHITDTANKCAWLCFHDMRCASLQFRKGNRQCELFSKLVRQSSLKDDPEYEVMAFKNV